MDERTQQATRLMTRFAERTGLTSERPPRRYLWTDAFAVCNFLALERATGAASHGELALRLVEQVHRTLGRHRPDDGRQGWISGLSEPEGEAHPTRGGLRIGKPLPERGPGEPRDERREWDRDGQYFHYLTKWMHALDRVARASSRSIFSTWAVELAAVAHRAFTIEPRPGGRKRMVWKLSIDLTRPLVDSMGQHDPLDGLITCVQLDATARALGSSAGSRLAQARADFAAMIAPDQLATSDPLGLGGLLVDACRVEQLIRAGVPRELAGLRDALLAAALLGLRYYVAGPELGLPANRRLAFRELGLAIGLAGIAGLEPVRGFEPLARFAPLRSEIESFWQAPAHREVETWRAHEDINDVMLATSLVPSGFLLVS
jgi:hypothetical protein